MERCEMDNPHYKLNGNMIFELFELVQSITKELALPKSSKQLVI